MKDLGIDGVMILKRILEKSSMNKMDWINAFITGSMTSLYEQGNKHSDSVN